MEKKEILIITLTEVLADITLTKQVLEKNGYKVIFANDTKEAMQVVAQVVATVIHQPSLSQWEWLNALLKIKKTHPDHPIFLHTSEDILEEGFSSAIGDSSTYLFNDMALLEKGLLDDTLQIEPTKRKILFVDDDPNILKSYLRLLRKSPWEILTASSGEEALSMLKTDQVDLIATDIKMPQMHGIELVTKIREINKDIPIIVCSGYQALKEDSNLQFQGVAGFIEKPIDTEKLKHQIEGILGT